jgi:hypothetical protein
VPDAPPFRALITATSWEAIHLLFNKVKARLAALAALPDGSGAWAAGVSCFDLKAARDEGMSTEAALGARLAVFAGTVWAAGSHLGPWEAPRAGYSAKFPGVPLGVPRGRAGNPGAALAPLPKLQLVMCDEASQLPAADALLVLDLVDPHSGRIVAMGDHLQLPPVLHGVYPKAEATATAAPGGGGGAKNAPPRPWTSLLDALRATLGGAAAAGVPGVAEHMRRCVLLDNHRMCATLSAFCRAPQGLYPAAYAPCDEPTGGDARRVCGCRNAMPQRRSNSSRAGGELPCYMPLHRASDADAWLAKVLDPAAKLVTVRVPAEERYKEGTLAAQLLAAAARAWNPHPTDVDAAVLVNEASRLAGFAQRVLVVAPHHRQIADLRLALSSLADPAMRAALHGVKINTVEKQQGQEADLVLILYGLKDAAAISGEAAFLYSQARLNVSLTRARCKVVLLLTRAVQEPELDAAGAASADVADGLALLTRAVRVCKRGSELAAAPGGGGVDVEEPLLGARYVRVVPRADGGGGSQPNDSQLSEMPSDESVRSGAHAAAPAGGYAPPPQQQQQQPYAPPPPPPLQQQPRHHAPAPASGGGRGGGRGPTAAAAPRAAPRAYAAAEADDSQLTVDDLDGHHAHGGAAADGFGGGGFGGGASAADMLWKEADEPSLGAPPLLPAQGFASAKRALNLPAAAVGTGRLHVCTLCRKPGHNVRTCPNKKAPKEEEGGAVGQPPGVGAHAA